MDNIMLEKLGITLNSMQEATADAVLHTDRDVVVISPTGSGKTYAYLLPLVQRLDASSDELQAVVLVPGRYGKRVALHATVWRTTYDGRTPYAA